MGACYSVSLEIKLKDEKGAIQALNESIRNDPSTNYNLDKYAAEGIGTETFDDLMRIYLAGWKNQEVRISEEDGFVVYENDFNASYGWETVLINMFDVLAPYCEDGTEMHMCPDSGRTVLVVRDGEAVRFY